MFIWKHSKSLNCQEKLNVVRECGNGVLVVVLFVQWQSNRFISSERACVGNMNMESPHIYNCGFNLENQVVVFVLIEGDWLGAFCDNI